MKNKKIIKVVGTGILVVGLAASSAGLALAADNSASSRTVSPGVQWLTGAPGEAVAGKLMISINTNMAVSHNVLKEALTELVTAGTITQTQFDDVLTYFDNNTPEKPVTKFTPPSEGTINLNESAKVVKSKVLDPLKDLVDKGTITQEQAQAIRDEMRNIADRQMQQQWQTSLDTLAGEGTVTQEQAGQILDFLAINNQKMQSMLDQAKDMSQEQSIKSLKENLGNTKDPVSQMVDQGIITQQQADAVREAVTGLSRMVTTDGSLGDGVSGGPVFFFSTSGAAPGDSQN